MQFITVWHYKAHHSMTSLMMAFALKSGLEEAALKAWETDPGRARRMLGLFADSLARRALEIADILAKRLNTEIAQGMHRHFSHEGLSW